MLRAEASHSICVAITSETFFTQIICCEEHHIISRFEHHQPVLEVGSMSFAPRVSNCCNIEHGNDLIQHLGVLGHQIFDVATSLGRCGRQQLEANCQEKRPVIMESQPDTETPIWVSQRYPNYPVVNGGS